MEEIMKQPLLYHLGALPTECLRCKALDTHQITNICASCYSDIARIQHSCLGCGAPLQIASQIPEPHQQQTRPNRFQSQQMQAPVLLPKPRSPQTCGKCLAKPNFIDLCLIACPFASPVDFWLRNLKDKGDLSALPTICQLLFDRLEILPDQPDDVNVNSALDLAIPIPIHWSRRCMRGYNQTELIAKPLASKLGIDLRCRILTRSRRIRSQRGLKWAERQRNQHNSFWVSDKASEEIKGKNILLVEDIVTTGATAQQAAKTLKSRGASKVVLIAVARTPESAY